jgi:hypothetical protein
MKNAISGPSLVIDHSLVEKIREKTKVNDEYANYIKNYFIKKLQVKDQRWTKLVKVAQIFLNQKIFDLITYLIANGSETMYGLFKDQNYLFKVFESYKKALEQGQDRTPQSSIKNNSNRWRIGKRACP